MIIGRWSSLPVQIHPINNYNEKAHQYAMKGLIIKAYNRHHLALRQKEIRSYRFILFDTFLRINAACIFHLFKKKSIY
jgi:hypothetical protein